MDGTVQMLPEYKAVSFIGYNYATAEDMDALYDYVSNGGVAVLSWPHLSITTNRKNIVRNKFDIIEHSLVNKMTNGAPEFTAEKINGIEVEVCTNLSNEFEVCTTTESGYPLKAELALGKGRIILINAKAYPYNAAIKDTYEDTVKALNLAFIKEEKAWIECGNDVEFTVYDQDNGTRDIYVLAVDWYNDPELKRSFTLVVDGYKYELCIPFGVMMKISVKDGKAVFAYSEDAEIVFKSSDIAVVQGLGEMTVNVAKEGIITTHELSFGDRFCLEISI